MKSNQLAFEHHPRPGGNLSAHDPPQSPDGDDSGDLNVTASVAITGRGAGRTIIDANQIDRALDIAPGQFVGLSDVTVRNGLQTFGGGISNDGILTITHSVIQENFGVFGGGVGVTTSGTLTVVGSIIRLNTRPHIGWRHVSGGFRDGS